MATSRYLAALALVALAACSTGPRPPLMSPLQPGARYGFVDRPLSDNRVEVRYSGPNRYGFGSYGRDSRTERAAVEQAYDFALWRAAQIALERNMRGFVVVDTRTDLRGRDEPGYYDRGFSTGIGVGLGTFSGPFGGGLGLGTGFGGNGPDYSTLQATVTLTVELRNDSAEKFYVADEVIEQARRTYPDAETASPK